MSFPASCLITFIESAESVVLAALVLALHWATYARSGMLSCYGKSRYHVVFSQLLMLIWLLFLDTSLRPAVLLSMLHCLCFLYLSSPDICTLWICISYLMQLWLLMLENCIFVDVGWICAWFCIWLFFSLDPLTPDATSFAQVIETSTYFQILPPPPPGWWHSIVVSVVWHMNEVTLRQARLVLGWVTVFGWVCHLGVLQPTRSTQPCIPIKGKVFPYSLPSVGPGADPSVQAVSPQVMWSESRHISSSSLPLLSARPVFTFVALTSWRYL